jgi:hypothetical protein
MNETVTFSEIVVIPMADNWEHRKAAGHRLPLIPLTEKALTTGPQPG